MTHTISKIIAPVLALAMLVAFIPFTIQAATFNVSNSSELQNALNQASGGDTIILASGNYGSVTINESYGSMVTIRSSTQYGAQFSSIYVNGSSNITIDGVKVEQAAEQLWTNLFNIENSSNIIVQNSWSNSTKYRYGNLFRVADSNIVSFIDNLASNGTYGFSLRKTSNLLLQGNEVHNFGADAFQYTSFDENHSNITFNENLVHTPDPRNPYNPQTGAHPDGIQFFNTGQGGSVSNVRVTNNVFLANNYTSDAPQYGSYFQGIFFGSECVNGAEVNNNFIYSNMPRGISANSCSSVTANGNTLLPTEAPHPSDFDRIPGYYGVSGSNNIYVGSAAPSGSNNYKLEFNSGDANYFRQCFGGLPTVAFNPGAVTNSNAKASCSQVPSTAGFQGNSWTGGGSVPVGSGTVPGGGTGTVITIDGVVTALENASDAQLEAWAQRFVQAAGGVQGAEEPAPYEPPANIENILSQLLELLRAVQQLQMIVLNNPGLASPQIVADLNSIAAQLAAILRALR